MPNERIEKFSKLYPDELKRMANNIPYHTRDKEWALLMYLMLHKQKGNIITLGKLSAFFDTPKDEIAYRLNRMCWLVDSYIISYGHGETVRCYKIGTFGKLILSKLLEVIGDEKHG